MAAPGVGAEAAPATSPLSLVQERFAAAARAFHQAHSAESSVAAQHDVMDVDGAADHGAPFKDLSMLAASVSASRAMHCLVVDHTRVASSDKDQLGVCLNMSLSQEQRIAAVCRWMPGVAAGLGLVYPDYNRLHLHFHTHLHLAQALKHVPCLVRCGVTSSGSWSSNCYGPSGSRHELQEALHFSCSYPTDVPRAPEHQLAAAKKLVATMNINAQAVWQSSSAAYDSSKKRFTFWVLPRETNPAALLALIERVHRKHELFGSAVDVQGKNMPVLQRCSECHKLGHTSSTCPKFGGVAVRLVFRKPMSPITFAAFVQLVPDVRSAMLGNTYISTETAGVTSHKATLFFDADESSPEKQQQFEELLQELGRQAGAMLQQPPCRIGMKEAERRQECFTCGARESQHVCPFRATHLVAQRPAQQQQAAQSSGAAVPKAGGSTTQQAAAAAPQPGNKQAAVGMCGSWRLRKKCDRFKCKQQHPEDWLPVPVREPQVCRDFYHQGCCKFERCKYEHWSLAQEQDRQRAEQQQAPVAASSASAVAGSAAAAEPQSSAPAKPAQKAASKKKAHTKQQQQQQQQQAASSSTNMFAALAWVPLDPDPAAAPSTPHKAPAQVPPSSLSSLTSPTRSMSTPGRAPARARSTSAQPTNLFSSTLAVGSGAAAEAITAAVAASENTQFVVTNNARKRKGPQQDAPLQQPSVAQQSSRRQRTQPEAISASAAAAVRIAKDDA